MVLDQQVWFGTPAVPCPVRVRCGDFDRGRQGDRPEPEDGLQVAVRAGPGCPSEEGVERLAAQEGGGRGRPVDRRDAEAEIIIKGAVVHERAGEGLRLHLQLPAGPCDMKSLQLSEDSHIREVSGGRISGQCPGPVSTLTCVVGNSGV